MKKTRTTKKANGFSLIEIVAVLLLIILLTMAFGSGRWMRVSVAAEAEVLRACLRYAEALAMANNTASWSVEVLDNAYTIRRNGLPSPFPLPGTSSSTHFLPANVHITGGEGMIDFNQWGAPSTSRVIVLSNGSQSRSVVIHGFTGLVP